MKVEEKSMKLRKILAVLLVVTMVLPLLTTSVYASDRLTTADALEVLKASMGLTTLSAEQLTRYGISGSPAVSDALRILRLSIGIVTEVRGNTSANIHNLGLAAIQGDLIYYANVNDGQKLYRMNADGTGSTKISDDMAAFINVVGDWIYYSGNGGDGWSIYKIRTDGTGRTNLNVNGGSINVIGDTIFYLMGGTLYRMNTDGTGNVKLIDDCRNYSIAGDWIYYMNNYEYLNYAQTYRMRINGSNKQTVAGFMTFVQDDLYINGYVTIQFIIQKINNGVLSENWIGFGPFGTIGVGGDWIYFCVIDTDWRDAYFYNSANGRFTPHEGNVDIKQGFYKVKYDGTGLQRLNDDYWTGFINVVGDWIFYYDYTTEKMYRMRTDGTQRQEVV
jgi:hypothetical protein